ncbi:MAG: transcription initiation factor IIB [Thermoprotei archaeon]|nr:hypothetical protein [Thermoproteales archaeon]RLE76448.1 MAG: transcription initiation factor IIB [Thermoprotei archaeon]RLE86146.1 MAG: transcription initiation factor IIB [Thermoprotei archaeon]
MEGEVKNSQCPYCGSFRIIFDEIRSEYVCLDCGAVLEDRLIEYHRFEKRIHSPEDWKKQRVGPKMDTRIDNLQSTDMGLIPYAKGLHKASKYRRIRKIHQRYVVEENRNFNKAKTEISRICGNLGILAVKNDAIYIYKKAAEKKLVRGRLVEGMAAACVYAACKLKKIGITLNSIEKVSKVNRRVITRNYKILIKNKVVKLESLDARHYVTRIVAELKLPISTAKIALKIIDKAREKRIGIGARPEGLAAASIYVASKITNNPRTQREIAQSSNITEVTLRNRYREILKKLNITVYI